MAKNPQQVAAKWRANTAASTTAMENGVNNVTEAPTARAAAAVDRMVAGVQRAAAEGKIQAGLQRVSLEDWKKAMREKGIPRVAQGVASAEGDMAAFMAEFLPHVEQLQSKLSSMPRGTLEQNISRMVETVRHNASFRRSRSRRR